MPTIGAGLQAYIAGQSGLPESASNRVQKPVSNFAYKPSAEETKRDIERDRKYAPIEREIFMANRRDPEKEMAQEAPRLAQEERRGPKIGMGLHRLLQDVKGAVREPIEKLGAGAREQFKELGNFPKIDLDNLPKGEIDPQKGAELATDLLHTTPAGAIAGTVKNVAKALERASWTKEQLNKWGSMGDDALSFMEYQLESAKRSASRFPEAKAVVKRWEEEIKEFKTVNKVDDVVEEITLHPIPDTPTVQTGRHSQSDGVSDEVVNWLESRKASGITRWVVKKDGSAVQLTGVNSRDYRVPEGAVLVDVQKGKPQVLDVGQGVPKAHVEGILARAAKNLN